MKRPDVFQTAPLKTMVAVGAVTSRSALLWMRTDRPGRLCVRWWKEQDPERVYECFVEVAAGNRSDHTATIKLPCALESSAPLVPLCSYRFRIRRAEDNSTIGEGRFETAPPDARATPKRFSLALISCHQPFDKEGLIQPSSSLLLRAMRKALEMRNAKFVLMMGDQMYADYPPNLSLFAGAYFDRVRPPGRETIHDCSEQEVRTLYQDRYRRFWNHPEWQALQGSIPCYPIVDDHDLVDNFGSRPIYQTPKWQNIGTGARWAYFDYQGSRVLPAARDRIPESFHFHFSYGNTATFVMDLRSQRTAGEDGQLFAASQADDLRAFLSAQRDKKIIFLVLSVPLVHLPRFLSRAVARLPHTGEDFADRWSSGAHLRDRDRMLKILHAHQRSNPQQRLVLLSGDIHIGCVHELRWTDGTAALHQVVSSPVTHANPVHIATASKMIIRANRSIATADNQLEAQVRLLKGAAGRNRNPFGGLNFGLVEVETEAAGADPVMRFCLYGHDEGEPVCVYRSQPLRGPSENR